MKMINIDELIEFCNTERSMLHSHNNSVACAALCRVVEFAKEYAVEAEPDNDWISVKDRLPDVSTAHTSQLVMVFSTNNEYEIYFDVYNSLSGKFMSEAQNGCKVTHWRPLPEPPKGE